MSEGPAPLTPNTSGTTRSPLTGLLAGSDTVTRGIQAFLAIGGVVASVKAQWDNNRSVFWISAAVVALSIVWFAVGAFLRKRRPKPPALPDGTRSLSSYLRGLLPFERGEGLLGREQEVGRLLALIRGLEYRVGFLSGEAGSGKTSVIRLASFLSWRKMVSRLSMSHAPEATQLSPFGKPLIRLCPRVRALRMALLPRPSPRFLDCWAIRPSL